MKNSMVIYDAYFVINVSYLGEDYVDTIEYDDLYKTLISKYQTESLSFLLKLRLLTTIESYCRRYNVVDNLLIDMSDGAIIFAINHFSFSRVYQNKIKDSAFIAVADTNNLQIIENVILGYQSFDTALFLTNAVVRNSTFMKELSIFHGCASLESICIDSSCKCRSIYDDYFGGCYSLKDVILQSNDLLQISLGAFNKCYSLKNIIIDVNHLIDIELNQDVIQNECKIYVPHQLVLKYKAQFLSSCKYQYVKLLCQI